MSHPLEQIENVIGVHEPPMLGEWRIVQAKVLKIHDPESILITEWKRRIIEPANMMFIGVRRVQCGEMKEEMEYSYEDGLKIEEYGIRRFFSATRFITVWLFVQSTHTNPVHVLPADALQK